MNCLFYKIAYSGKTYNHVPCSMLEGKNNKLQSILYQHIFGSINAAILCIEYKQQQNKCNEFSAQVCFTVRHFRVCHTLGNYLLAAFKIDVIKTKLLAINHILSLFFLSFFIFYFFFLPYATRHIGYIIWSTEWVLLYDCAYICSVNTEHTHTHPPSWPSLFLTKFRCSRVSLHPIYSVRRYAMCTVHHRYNKFTVSVWQKRKFKLFPPLQQKDWKFYPMLDDFPL